MSTAAYGGGKHTHWNAQNRAFRFHRFVAGRSEYRLPEPVWPLRTLVSVQAAGALQKQIDRRDVGDHQVEVEVKTLLDHLGGASTARFGRRTGTVVPSPMDTIPSGLP